MNGKGLLAGLLFGVAAGAVFGVICAPRPGKETREQLAEAAEKVKETLKERAKCAPIVLIMPIAFQYQPQDQSQHHYPAANGETS
jgi:hypothetical protein